jgi:hypothetical protein
MARSRAPNGSLCGISDLNKLALINQLYASTLDSISTGAVIAFAMECYERGILTKAMTGGLDLTCGNVDDTIALAIQIGKREGTGARSCPCTIRAARKGSLSRTRSRSPAPITWAQDPLHARFHPQGHPTSAKLAELGIEELAARWRGRTGRRRQ